MRKLYKILLFCFSTLLLVQAGYGTTLTGKFFYGNNQIKPLTYIIIKLEKENPITGVYTQIAKTATDVQGNYTFLNLEPNKKYRFKVASYKPWGGVDMTDAIAIMNHFTGIITLQPPFLAAADVNGDGAVNSVDAMLVGQRANGLITSFPVGDWYYELPVFMYVSGVTYYRNIRCVCYGDVNGSYTPPAVWACYDAITDADGYPYFTQQIGTQCWMKQNLNTGIALANFICPSNNQIIEKHCYDCEVYGGLYRWNEMMNYGNSGTQGICPTGWHVPSADEWCTLLTLVDNQTTCYADPASTTAGGPLKEVGTAHWQPINLGGTDAFGFSALPSGFSNGCTEGFDSGAGYFWSSTESSADHAWFWELFSDETFIHMVAPPKTYGFAVRCLKD